MATAPISVAAAALTDPHDVVISSAVGSLFDLYHDGIGSLFAATELSIVIGMSNLRKLTCLAS
ncbi:uncharacterized protein RHOBADRAFT_52463 [Rhodotorula graminis WP1]|uniref:Uncharacterized protein n=1 Tax=Rhodotorula graminis (strain WP1) TaxID=578459 RepID=A0A194S796_RHOGW|nr:uncharacterized protein RHOBADRAFT_52463 [Rhodotorula graminis WP1]KPV76457.1 hypothetical protein RHOBADRAFT_52463 [Rhodotorula graminis WP1]